MREKAAAFFRKQKKEQWILYFLLAAIGIVMLLPTGKKETDEEEKAQTAVENQEREQKTAAQETMEQRLAEALAQMDGVGRVRVALTMESTGKKIVEKDVPVRSSTEENKKGEESSSAKAESQEEATVYEKTGNGTETPYVISEEYPKIRGVLVIAEGGDNPVTVREIQEAVMALFQVGANKIKVVKMK